jgi:hypothetical protein
MALAILFALIVAPASAGKEPTATAVITDRNELTASDKFGVPNQFRVGDNGEVFFTSGGNSALFRWSQAGGAPSRLVQTNDPLEVLLSLPGDEFAGGLVDAVGLLLQVNAAGHAAFVASAATKGEYDPAGIFVYDGSSYRFIDTPLGIFSQLLLNNNDRVAVMGNRGDSPVTLQAIYMETGSGLVKVAEQSQPIPENAAGLKGTFGTLQLIGFNDAGQVAFMASIGGSPGVNRVLFLSDGKSLRVVAVNGGSTNNFMLLTGPPQYGVVYALNNAGQVAFVASKDNSQPAIWIGDGSGVPQKVMGLGDPTGVTGWGNYASPLWLRGFDDSGRVLYDSNTTSAPNYALFVKGLNDAAPQVVFHRGQQGGPQGQNFFSAEQAAMNNAKVLFLARSSDGRWGWYLGSAGAPPPLTPGQPPDAVAVAIQGDPTPLGGTFGLGGRNVAGTFALSGANHVAFLADIPDLNAAGLFTWKPDGTVTPVVTSKDTLPDGANTVMRPGPPTSSDDEVLVRVLQAGGQTTYYAKQIKPGMSGLRKIVAEFDEIPDAGTVISPGGFVMNAKGVVLFTGSLLGSNFYPRAGILASLPETGLERTVLAGDSAPGGGNFTSFGSPQINNENQMAFFAQAGTGGAGIYIASQAAGVKAVARQNSQWPGGGQFANFGNTVALNDKGLVAFRGGKAGTGTQPGGLFVGTSDADSIKAVAVTGQDLAGGKIGSVPNSVFKLNAAGQVAFYAGMSGAHNGGILLGSGDGAPQAIALAGDPAPGVDKTTYGFFREESVDLNASGQVAFWAGLCCGNVGNGWFLGSAADNVAPRLLHGQRLPGGSPAGQLAPGNRMAALADSGEMAIYVQDVTQSHIQPQVVIAGADGKLREFVNNGDKAEGTGSEFAKLFPMLAATPAGRFLAGAVLINGPAQAGIFIDKP